mmetsp:Transcript_42047/g.75811  ORF Transcript_42047/g.75811 Transcript_42047/m.75811 type:complete len:336 (+) Transcript_42047:74-1081(+)|eukprot:CAMPEP_0201926776 /NCGR_PEP_ID=MMETSP0903-20130614/16951_1 /ASSEMBLY_ACC=CAM_ASM_000552 /TAXON_ID=420261 /ORGANISM="Thalassiosira antarctica, Strain CCMP982" /LENGTH=335 /DNA_ID=CAMNT_0048464743 /DNA_START=6 /DNA_END=1013 /DNA_ORIENTATION=-
MKISSTNILFLAASSPLSSAQLRPYPVDDLVVNPVDYPDRLKFLNKKCKTYSMTFADRDYMHEQQYPVTYADGLGNPEIKSGMSWGLHALLWKALQDATNNGGEYDGLSANDSNAPAQNPNVGENHVSPEGSDRLNELESADSGIFTDSNGVPTDPGGTWVYAMEDDALAGAILAAMNMFYWKTPTYVDTKDWQGNDGGVAVIEKVHLCAEGVAEPDVACNWLPRGSYNSTCDGTLSFEWIKLARFDGGGVYSDGDNEGYHVLKPNQWEEIYGKPGFTPVLVFDPPAGTTDDEIEDVKRQAEKIAHDSLVDQDELEDMIKSGKSNIFLGPGGLRG